MRVIYRPENGEGGGEWEFDPRRVRVSEAEMIERRYGKPWDAFSAGVQAGDSKARRVLLWHLYRTQHPAYRFEDVPDFYTGEVTCEYEAHELAELIEAIRDAALPEDEKATMLAGLQGELDKATRTADGEVVPLGKARSASGG